MTKPELKSLQTALQTTTKTFRRTQLYNILKTELTKLGYWKAQGRGNPKKGFSKSVAAQQQAQFKQSLKDTSTNYMDL
jgi:hypothetical protein